MIWEESQHEQLSGTNLRLWTSLKELQWENSTVLTVSRQRFCQNEITANRTISHRLNKLFVDVCFNTWQPPPCDKKMVKKPTVSHCGLISPFLWWLMKIPKFGCCSEEARPLPHSVSVPPTGIEVKSLQWIEDFQPLCWLCVRPALGCSPTATVIL